MSDELEIHPPGEQQVQPPGYVDSEPDVSAPASVEEPSSSAPRLGSLEDRVARRRATLEDRHTELFDVPGFEDVFRVELKPVSFKRLTAIAEKHGRVTDSGQQTLRIGADQLAEGTVAFHAIVNDEGDTELDENASWQSLWLGYQEKVLKLNITDSTRMGMTPRAAIIGLLGATGTTVLAGQFFQWATSGASAAAVEQELARD